ncbi:MAG: NADPH-dependent 7-cyano-7-deazaguanine reductase QueF, partial [Xanthomonadales bacterium]|nr:NADPH-dependent 7-cyano-7-deazaguanine reductase QueF [Xanthomonadales bacterium]
MNTPQHSALGQASHYAQTRDPSLLYPIARAQGRAELGLVGKLPFVGLDLWNAYEFSWLDPRGKPHVAMLELRVGADSPALIESKSLKLYLGSYAQTRMADTDALLKYLNADLSAAAGTPIDLQLIRATQFANQQISELHGQVIDDQSLDIDTYGPPDPSLLHVDSHAAPQQQTLVSHLLKSNCPVTGQPDWASVQIEYVGAPIDPASLLRYIVSFRQHSGFHEQCVERIFVDLMERCAP